MHERRLRLPKTISMPFIAIGHGDESAGSVVGALLRGTCLTTKSVFDLSPGAATALRMPPTCSRGRHTWWQATKGARQAL